MLRKTISFIIIFSFILEQAGLAQVAPQLGVPAYLQNLAPVVDKFRPIHLRSLSFDRSTNNFDVLLDKGDAKQPQKPQIEETAKKLLKYFKIGLALPNSMFWVNLRPDAPRDIIDPYVEQTDLGKVLLEADLQLKKDMARFTAPNTPEGKAYWDKLYQKAELLYGGQDMVIPTVTRPWIVPGEIIIGEAKDSAYVYKATLKVMLEQDYLKDAMSYGFDDERAKQLNDYSSQILRELIIPKLTREVNAAKSYAALRQVFYSLVLAQWFKQRFGGAEGAYAGRIDTKDLSGLTSTAKWSKDKYYQAYKKSFSQGEYNRQETIYGMYGQTIRSYFSGGAALTNAVSRATATVTAAMPNPAGLIAAHVDGPMVDVTIPNDMHEPGMREELNKIFQVPAGVPEDTVVDFIGRARPSKDGGKLVQPGNTLTVKMNELRNVMQSALGRGTISPENAGELAVIEPSLNPDAQIVLFSCSTGRKIQEESNLADHIARALKRETLAPQEVASGVRVMIENHRIAKLSYRNGQREPNIKLFMPGTYKSVQRADSPASAFQGERRKAVVVYPTADHNGAFNDVDRLMADLKADDFEVHVYRVSSVDELVENIKPIKGIDVLVIGGHGTQQSLYLGIAESARNDIVKRIRAIHAEMEDILRRNKDSYTDIKREWLLLQLRWLMKFSSWGFHYGRAASALIIEEKMIPLVRSLGIENAQEDLSAQLKAMRERQNTLKEIQRAILLKLEKIRQEIAEKEQALKNIKNEMELMLQQDYLKQVREQAAYFEAQLKKCDEKIQENEQELQDCERKLHEDLLLKVSGKITQESIERFLKSEESRPFMDRLYQRMLEFLEAVHGSRAVAHHEGQIGQGSLAEAGPAAAQKDGGNNLLYSRLAFNEKKSLLFGLNKQLRDAFNKAIQEEIIGATPILIRKVGQGYKTLYVFQVKTNKGVENRDFFAVFDEETGAIAEKDGEKEIYIRLDQQDFDEQGHVFVKLADRLAENEDHKRAIKKLRGQFEAFATNLFVHIKDAPGTPGSSVKVDNISVPFSTSLSWSQGIDRATLEAFISRSPFAKLLISHMAPGVTMSNDVVWLSRGSAAGWHLREWNAIIVGFNQSDVVPHELAHHIWNFVLSPEAKQIFVRYIKEKRPDLLGWAHRTFPEAAGDEQYLVNEIFAKKLECFAEGAGTDRDILEVLIAAGVLPRWMMPQTIGYDGDKITGTYYRLIADYLEKNGDREAAQEMRGYCARVFPASQEDKAQPRDSGDIVKKDLIPQQDVAIEYQQPITIRLAPHEAGAILKVVRYGDDPAKGYFIIQEGFIPGGGQPLGYKSLGDGESYEIGRSNNKLDPRFELNNAISRVHARVTRRGTMIMIRDLDSSNGTRVEYAATTPLPDGQKASERLNPFIEAIQKGMQPDESPNATGAIQKGAVLDLRDVKADTEVILVGDLHTRKDNLEKIISNSDNLAKIKSGKAVLIILGDAVHNEYNLTEMDSSVEIMQTIMDLKIASPHNVYYLLGNHDYLTERTIKGGFSQGLLYREKLEALFGADYVEKYNTFLKASPVLAVGNGFAATHAGPIRGDKTLADLINVDVSNEDDPVVHQAMWGRYLHPDQHYYYNLDDVRKFLVRLGLKEDAIFIVAHSPERDGNWHWEKAANHHVIFAAEDRAGYARITGGSVEFVEVKDGGNGLRDIAMGRRVDTTSVDTAYIKKHKIAPIATGLRSHGAVLGQVYVYDETESPEWNAAQVRQLKHERLDLLVYNPDNREYEFPVILSIKTSNPGFNPVIIAVDGVISAQGGITSHAYAFCEENHITSVVGVGNDVYLRDGDGFKPLASGDWVTLDGENGLIYQGILPIQFRSLPFGEVWLKKADAVMQNHADTLEQVFAKTQSDLDDDEFDAMLEDLKNADSSGNEDPKDGGNFSYPEVQQFFAQAREKAVEMNELFVKIEEQKGMLAQSELPLWDKVWNSRNRIIEIIDSSRLKAAHEEYDINDTIKKAVAQAGSEDRSALLDRIKIVSDPIDTQNEPPDSYPETIKDVLYNIVKNSTKWADKMSPITASIDQLPKTDEFLFTLKDQGPGMSPEKMEDLHVEKTGPVTIVDGVPSSGYGTFKIYYNVYNVLRGNIKLTSVWKGQDGKILIITRTDEFDDVTREIRPQISIREAADTDQYSTGCTYEITIPRHNTKPLAAGVLDVKSETIGKIRHDVNNQVLMIDGFLSLMSEAGNVPPEAKTAVEKAQAIHKLVEATKNYSGSVKDGGDVDELIKEGQDFLMQKTWYMAIGRFALALKKAPATFSALVGLQMALKGYDLEQKAQKPRKHALSEPEIHNYIISQARALGLIDQNTQIIKDAMQYNLSENATVGFTRTGVDKADAFYIFDRFVEKLGELNEMIAKRDNTGLNNLVKRIIEISMFHEQGHLKFGTDHNEALAQKNVRDSAGSLESALNAEATITWFMILSNYFYGDKIENTVLMDETLMHHMVRNRLTNLGDLYPDQSGYHTLYSDDEIEEIAKRVLKLDKDLRPLMKQQAKADGGIVAQAIYDMYSDRTILKTHNGEKIFSMKIVPAPRERASRENAPQKMVFFDNLPEPETPEGRSALEGALVDAMRIALFANRRYVQGQELLSEQYVAELRQISDAVFQDALARNFFIAGANVVIADKNGKVRMVPAEKDLAVRLLRSPVQPKRYYERDFEFQRTVWDVEKRVRSLRPQRTLDDFSARSDGGKKLEERALKMVMTSNGKVIRDPQLRASIRDNFQNLFFPRRSIPVQFGAATPDYVRGLALEKLQAVLRKIHATEPEALPIILPLMGEVANKYIDYADIKTEVAPQAMKLQELISELQTPKTADPQSDKDGGKGGIDLRALPVMTKPLESLATQGAIVIDPKITAVLNGQWGQIQAQMQQGAMPYKQIKEYVSACNDSQARGNIDQVVSCIANILRLEEDAAVATPAELKEILSTIG